MSAALVAGVDSSTQSVKVELRSLEGGEVVASASARHPSVTPPVAEQDPGAWWAALVEAFEQLGDARGDVVAMAVAGQQHGLVVLGEDGGSLRPAKLWNDTTSAPQAERLREQLGARRWAELVGSVPVASFTISKLAWLAEHEPEVLDRTAMVQLPHDHLTWRLTGEHVTDRGDASGTGWWDATNACVHDELLAAATGDGDGWSGRLPRVLGPTEPAGTVTDEAAAALGLPGGVVVGPGSGDNMGAALGLGMRAGDVTISLGTSGTAFAVADEQTRDASGAVAGFASASGAFLPLVCTLNATRVTDVVASWLGTDAPGLAALALETAADPGSVHMLGYLDGERTPDLPDATGTLAGITTATTRAQVALAAHDGVLCGLVAGVDALREHGAVLDGRVLLVGGGARSAAYRQRAADLFERSVVVPDTDETVAAGAACQAAAVHDGSDLEDVAQRWSLGHGTTVEPRHDASVVLERHRALRGSSLLPRSS